MATEQRLIDANEVIKETESILNFRKQHHMPTIEYEALLGYLKKRPTVDAAPVVHGRWELHGNDDDCGCSYFCSNCHKSYDEDYFYAHGQYIPYHYCPNCGAKMDGGNENG